MSVYVYPFDCLYTLSILGLRFENYCSKLILLKVNNSLRLPLESRTIFNYTSSPVEILWHFPLKYITACLGCVPISCYNRKITLKDSARAVCMASSVSTWRVFCVFTSRHAPVLPPIQMADELLAGTGSRDKYAIPFYLYPCWPAKLAPSITGHRN